MSCCGEIALIVRSPTHYEPSTQRRHTQPQHPPAGTTHPLLHFGYRHPESSTIIAFFQPPCLKTNAIKAPIEDSARGRKLKPSKTYLHAEQTNLDRKIDCHEEQAHRQFLNDVMITGSPVTMGLFPVSVSIPDPKPTGSESSISYI